MRNFKFICPPFWLADPVGKRKLREFLDSFTDNAKIVDMGSGTRRLDPRAINIDLFKANNVNILGDAHNIPVKDGSVDGIVATGLMEYMRDPKEVAEEFHRILKRGGKLYVTCPFIKWDHSDSEVLDRFRFTKGQVKELFGAFEVLELFNKGSARATCEILVRFGAILFSFGNRYLFAMWNLIFTWMVWPIKFLDLILFKTKYDYLITQSFTLIGEKR